MAVGLRGCAAGGVGGGGGGGGGGEGAGGGAIGQTLTSVGTLACCTISNHRPGLSCLASDKPVYILSTHST